MDYKAIATEVLALVGSKSNVVSYTNCVTRLRIKVKDLGAVDIAALKKVTGVLGINENGQELQIIFGPGKVAKAKDALDAVYSEGVSDVFEAKSADSDSIEDIARREKEKSSKFQNAGVKAFFSKFANIFVPLIPGFIGAGLLTGFSILFATIFSGINSDLIAVGSIGGDILAFMGLFNTILMAYLYVMVAYNASKSFGGSGVIGAIVGGMFVISPSVINNGTEFEGILFGLDYNVNGGMIGALMASIISAKVEVFLSKYIPDAIDMMVRPLITLVVTGLFTFFVIMPVAQVLFDGMSFLFETLNSSILGNGFLAGTFLGAVLLGIHQGFVPVYEGLVDTIGFNSLFPVLAMAGAGQVGAAIAIYGAAAKDSQTRNIIRGAIIPGFMGVGEPLIYGVTLPRVRPFFTAAAGGVMGGLTIGLFAKLGMPFGLNTVFGPSGLMALPLMKGGNGVNMFEAMGLYLIALCVAYVSGYIFTRLFGLKGVDLS